MLFLPVEAQCGANRHVRRKTMFDVTLLLRVT